MSPIRQMAGLVGELAQSDNEPGGSMASILEKLGHRAESIVLSELQRSESRTLRKSTN